MAVNHIVNNAGITFLSRILATSKAGIGEAIAAYLQADREAGARELRAKAHAAAGGAQAVHDALLAIEEALETATRQILEGGRADLPRALEPLRARPSPS